MSGNHNEMLYDLSFHGLKADSILAKSNSDIEGFCSISSITHDQIDCRITYSDISWLVHGRKFNP
jgi:hypothetical protein